MGPSRTPEGTALLTPGGLLIRDSESFGPRFRAAEGTLKVPFGPRRFSLETEIATRLSESSQTVAGTGDKRKAPGSRSLDAGR
jgi:hypothetical protein